MFVEHLEVRKPSYGDSDEERKSGFLGRVQLKGVGGSQTINLSPLAISQIFKVISEEVDATARKNAKAVKTGMDEAVHSPLLLQASQVGQSDE